MGLGAVAGCSSAIVGCSSAVVGCSSAVVGCPSAVVGCSSAVVGCSSAVVGCSSAVEGCSSAVSVLKGCFSAVKCDHLRYRKEERHWGVLWGQYRCHLHSREGQKGGDISMGIVAVVISGRGYIVGSA